MTKKRNLTTLMIAIMIMLFSLSANALGTVGYAQWDESRNTLTFYGGKSVPSGAYELNTGVNAPGWSGNTSCTTVVFDESFIDVKPTSCCSWFNEFSSLETIEGIENFNTEEVTNMSKMFYGCSSVTSLDLSSFNTAKVTDMSYMFYNCQGLTTIYVSDDFTTSTVTSGSDMFTSCDKLVGAAQYSQGNTGIDMANYNDGYFTKSKLIPYVKWNEDTNVLTFKVANTKEEGSGVYDLNDYDNAPGWLDLNYDCTKIVFTPSFKQARPTSCCQWFYNFYYLTTIQGIENLNTEEVTEMWYMFNNCMNLTSLDLSSFNTAKVTGIYGMFYGCSGLTSLDLSSFNTAEVTNMSYMFHGCSKLTSLDLSSFNTAKVTDMSGMFGNCSKLTSLDLSSFNTAKVTDMSGMFLNCSRLTSLDVSKFNTEKVTNMSDMFNGCSDLTSLDVSKLNTAKVTDMSGMFNNCRNLTSLDLSSFNTAEVTDMSDMFQNCSGLTSLDVSKFNTEKVTNISAMFRGCSGLTSLDVSKFNTARVRDMSGMFDGCLGLTSLDVSKFNTAKVTNMSYMFHDCRGLTSLYLSKFNTARVWNMSAMFRGCSGLTSLDLSSFNTEKVTIMSGMFRGCSGLTSLDLSSFNTAEVTDMGGMFYGCTGLTTIYVSDDFATGNVSFSDEMFRGCRKLIGNVSFVSNKTDHTMANYTSGYFTPKIITPYVKWDASTKVLTFKVANTKEEGNGVYDLNKDASAPVWSFDEVKNNCTKVVFTSSFNHARPTSCYKWFDGLSQLQTIQGIENLNTAEVTYMSSMFNSCSGLTSLDVSSFNTVKVTDMSYMFSGCSGLSSLDLSSFNTAEVTDMSYMFQNCSGLTSLDLSSLNTTEVTNMSSMFYDCTGLTTIYVSDDFATGNVSSSDKMFWDCSKLIGNVSFDSNKTDHTMANYTSGYFTKSNLTPYVKWNGDTNVLTFKVANYTKGSNGEYKLNDSANAPGWSNEEMYYNCTKVVFTPSFKQARPTSCFKWFYNFSKLTTIQGIENLNTEEVTDMSYMFYSCCNLASLDVSKFNTAKVTDMSYMFHDCQGLTSLDVSKFNTAEVTNMSDMFNRCEGLTSLDVSSFNTAKVTNMSSMFNSCEGLTSLDVSSFNTAKVTDMSGMFSNCSGLTSLDVSKFNTAEVKYMSSMFWNCWGLTSLDLSSFNTAKVTGMYGMFYRCSGLSSLDLSSFNTAEVTNMGNMFDDCRNLTSLDLSSFNTAKVTGMSGMFAWSSKLKTIYVSDDYTTDNVSSSDNMFYNCTSLKGGAQYTSDKLDQSMANYKTGYFKTYFTLGENKVELCGEPLTTESLDLAGDKDFVAHAPFTAASANYSRNLSSSESTWFSLCLPFAYTPQNFAAYQLKGATADAVEIEEITGEIAAGTPVLFKFKDGVVDVNKIINISATGANIVKAPVDGARVDGTDGSSLQLCGTYQTKTFSSEDGNAFILLNNKLMNPAKMLDKGVTKVGVKPFRAYMTLTASAESSVQQASARAFSIGRGGEDEGTTAIDLLNSVATDDAEYYDINGRRIDAPAKGVNIVRRGNKTIKLIIK